MVKKISVLALAGLIALPALSMAGGSGGKGSAANVDDLERKIEELSRQLDELKAQMGKQGEVDAATSQQLSDLAGDLEGFEVDLDRGHLVEAGGEENRGEQPNARVDHAPAACRHTVAKH